MRHVADPMTAAGPIVIRRATRADLAAIVQMDDEEHQANADRTDYLSQVLQSETCFVAHKDVILGLVVVRRGHFFGRDFVDYLRVRADHRRMGIGRLLLRESVTAATSARVFTSTNESNHPMQQLLASERWQFSGRLGGLDEGDPELVYFLDARV
jgi:ribosomal protein S18 acetylase RimI-like enzyme